MSLMEQSMYCTSPDCEPSDKLVAPQTPRSLHKNASNKYACTNKYEK